MNALPRLTWAPAQIFIITFLLVTLAPTSLDSHSPGLIYPRAAPVSLWDWELTGLSWLPGDGRGSVPSKCPVGLLPLVGTPHSKEL